MKNFSATSWNETLAKMNLKIFKDNINDVSIYMDAWSGRIGMNT